MGEDRWPPPPSLAAQTQMWAAAEARTFALRSPLRPHPPWSRPSVSPTACWSFGRLATIGIGTATGSSVNPHCPSLRPPLPLQFFCNFPRRLCYLRRGERCQASSADTDSTSPLPLCQHDDSAAPAGFFSLPPPCLPPSPPPPPSYLAATPRSSDKAGVSFFPSLNLIHKRNKILEHPSGTANSFWLKAFSANCWKKSLGNKEKVTEL